MNSREKKELEIQIMNNNKKNMNIGIPSSISPRNQKNSSFKTDSEHGEAVIIDD